MGQMGQPERHRIGPGQMRQLVHRAFAEEHVLRIANRPPRPHRHHRRRAKPGDAVVGKDIGLIRSPLHQRRVRAGDLVAQPPGLAFDDAGRTGFQIKGGDHAARHLGTNPGLRGGAVEIMRHVFFAAPGQQNRGALHRLGHGDHLPDDVHFRPPTKATAHQHRLHRHGGGGQPGDRRTLLQDLRRQLIARPDRQLAVLQQRGGGHRLHRRMSQVGGGIGGGQDVTRQRGIHVAIVTVAAVLPVGGEAVGQNLRNRRRIRRIGRRLPVKDDRLGGVERRPRRVGNHSDPPRHRHDLCHPRHRPGRAGVKRHHPGPKVRIGLRRCKQHPRQPQIAGERRRAGDFGQHVHPRLRFAQQPPLGARLRLRCLRQRHRCSPGGQFHIGQTGAIGGNDRAALGLQRVCRHPQPRGRRLHQRRPRRRPGQPHLVKGVDHRRRATGDLKAQKLARHMHRRAHILRQPAFIGRHERRALLQHTGVEIGRRGGAVDDGHGGQVQIHLLGHQSGQSGVDALPHLGARRDDGHPLGVDHHKRVQRRRPLSQTTLQRVAVGRGVFPPAEHRPAGHRHRPEQKRPARNFPDAGHPTPPSAAQRHL